jgi:hypothetical protein
MFAAFVQKENPLDRGNRASIPARQQCNDVSHHVRESPSTLQAATCAKEANPEVDE